MHVDHIVARGHRAVSVSESLARLFSQLPIGSHAREALKAFLGASEEPREVSEEHGPGLDLVEELAEERPGAYHNVQIGDERWLACTVGGVEYLLGRTGRVGECQDLGRVRLYLD